MLIKDIIFSVCRVGARAAETSRHVHDCQVKMKSVSPFYEVHKSHGQMLTKILTHCVLRASCNLSCIGSEMSLVLSEKRSSCVTL